MVAPNHSFDTGEEMEQRSSQGGTGANRSAENEGAVRDVNSAVGATASAINEGAAPAG